MEYASGGELFDYIVANTRLEAKEACRFFQQIIAGIEYIHKLGVVHRDLKPENLLLDSNKNIKIVDFGLSNTYKPGELLQTACGSPCYAAPEMIAGNKYVGTRVDLWSSGVILFAMVSGYLPFEDPNTSELYKKILNCEYEVPDWVNGLTQDFLKKILNTDPEKRFTIEEIRKHSWFTQVDCKAFEGILVGYTSIPINKEILNKLTVYNFDIEHSQKCIEANKHNHITTTYYLLMKKFRASEGSVQLPSEKAIFPRPPLLPFAPLLTLNIKPNLRHRKYIEKKIDSTAGSSVPENEHVKIPFSPAGVRITKSNVHIKQNSPSNRQLRSRRYVSAGKIQGKIPTPRSASRPIRLKPQKSVGKSRSSSKNNQTFDNRLNSSFKKKSRFLDLSSFK